jgi:uncharacterized protein (TIRG00374 family)
MPESSRTRTFPWHALIIAALTIALLWGFVQGADWSRVWEFIQAADRVWIAAAIAMTLLGYVLRAWRWQVLLKPLGRVRFRHAFRTTVIGFTVTNLLPGRMGEVVRPYLLARAEGLEFSSAFGTIIIERTFLDLASILSLFACFLLTTTMDVPVYLKVVGVGAGVTAVAVLGLLVLCAGHPERLGRWAGRLAAVLPGRAAEAVTKFVRALAEGLAVMRRPGPLVAAVGLSILLWLSIAMGIWLTSKAFDLTLARLDSFLVVSYVATGVSIPTPGGLGGFEWGYREAARLLSVGPDKATAVAVVLHAVSFLPVTLLGLFFMWQDRLTLGGMRNVKATVESSGGDRL